jgi:hypothetical protein
VLYTEQAKLLGAMFCTDLSWNAHFDSGEIPIASVATFLNCWARARLNSHKADGCVNVAELHHATQAAPLLDM